MGSFSADPIEMERVGKKDIELAADFGTEVDKIYAEVGNLSSIWQGTDADVYVNKAKDDERPTRDLGLTIDEYGQIVLRASKRVRDIRDSNASNAGRL